MIEMVKGGDVARIDVRFLLSEECRVEDLVVVLVSELVGVPKRPPAYKISDPLPILHTSKAFSHCILPLQPVFRRHFSNAYFL